ncbi:uncharacterized protein LOC119725824 isoform X2 [Patiria miniata]|uniref:Uncharacterized protein n=1 Tax=Patiria miniata TaxID=46514 RepID=A0A913ZPP3_PATMI|nr:uncharacterized protein LOC119725824 isoform X2 [Patiria miniata]
MQLSTKKCLLTYTGAIMFAFGFGIMLEGISYKALPSNDLNLNAVVRAVPHWCGMLLLLLGARNFTFGLAQWKYGMNCCGSGACEVVFVNLLALVVSGCAIGMTIWGSFENLKSSTAETIAQKPDFIYLIGIWFMSMICAILALLSMFAGCLPIGSPSEEEDVIEMQQYGHDNPQFSKY